MSEPELSETSDSDARHSSELEELHSSELGRVASIHPDNFPFFIKIFAEWMTIQNSRVRVMAMQKKLQHILLLYMKKRQRRLRMIEAFNGPKMMSLLEHIRSPFQFLKLFRIKLRTFFQLKETLYTDPDTNPPGWMPEIELLLFLFWLSGGLSYKKVEKILGVPETILKQMFHSLFDRFLKVVCQVIRFPEEECAAIGQGFAKLADNHIFGLVVGFLDAFHVMIGFPSQKDDLQYLNDMNDFSVQVQAVCDHRGVLMDIAVGFPGSMLKPHVLQCTPLYLGRLLPPRGYVLLSGTGYPCLQEPICVIPPYLPPKDNKKPTTGQQKLFNLCHGKSQSAMVKSIGQMFDRWRRIFSKPIMHPLSDITNIIIACAMIHNIELELGNIWPKQSKVNFNVNQEHSSLVEGQKSGEITQRNMVNQIKFSESKGLEVIFGDESEDEAEKMEM